MSLSLAGALSLIGILMTALPHSRLFGRLVLKSSSSSVQKGIQKNQDEPDEQTIQPGMHTRALTDLRPVGKAMFGGREYIVRTEGEYIDRDETIVVLRKEGLSVVVRRG